MLVYAAETDPLCYPGTTVLRNILDIHDQAELDELELALFLTRADEAFPAGDLDYPHYLALHRHLFQDVYAWAGESRTIRIRKGGNWFCYPEYINAEMHRVFAELSAANHYIGATAEVLAAGAAHVLAEINAIHPFREGNGRTQLAFLAMLADNAGYGFNDDKLEPDRVMQAMIDSFSGDEAPLSDLIRDIIA
ncbi:Fic/DOC family protein [Mesorhizobium sp. RCC_202]|uniref:Fic/DOC family protein n=1 Tax=Mesorhizobium sp. RCC_202 TaxID=3239222 RepID=UPI00352644A1